MIVYQDCSGHLDSSITWPPVDGAYCPYIIYIENLKNLLVRNFWTDINICLQKCFFTDRLPRLFKPSTHGRQGAGLIFPIYLYRKLQKSSCQKPLDWFQYNLAEMFSWWPSIKIVQVIMIRQETWLPGGQGLYSLCIYIENLKKIFLSETTGPI